MKKNLLRMFCVGILCCLTVIVGFAQNDRTLSSAAGDLYLISAKAGVVNYVEGGVSIQRKNGNSGYLLKGDSIEVGDKVSTTANARAEVLLNPGSFVRLDQNSEFEFVTTSLDDLKLQVNKGSAIFEVFASNDFKVLITTPKAKFYLVETGVYRVDVLDNGVGKLEVRRGKAQVGNLLAEEVEKGRTATVDTNDVVVAKFDRGNEDSFEDWSKDRAKMIAKVNSKLSSDRLTNSLLSNNNGFDCFNSLGLWVYSRQYTSYSFLPFGYAWRSPYGYGFGTSTGICNNPYQYYRYIPTYRGNPGTGNNGGGNGGVTPTTPAANIARGQRNLTPPFRRMENTGNSNSRSSSSRRNFPTFPDSSNDGSRGSRSDSSTRTTNTQNFPTRTVPSSRTSPRSVKSDN